MRTGIRPVPPPTLPPYRERRREDFQGPRLEAGRGTNPALDAMDVDMDESVAGPSRGGRGESSRMPIPAIVEPRRPSWGWPIGGHGNNNNNSEQLPTNPIPHVTGPQGFPSRRRADSPSPQDRHSPLPSNNDASLSTTRSSILSPAGGALARAFNFAVPRLNLGGGGGEPSTGSTPTREGAGGSGGSGGSGGEERTRRGFFRGLSGGSNEDRPRRGSSGGDVDM